jgi:hypothetical protein
MPRILMTEEQLVRYIMSFTKIMEPWEAFSSRAMKQFSV